MVETTAKISKTFNVTGKLHLKRSIEIMVSEAFDRSPQSQAKKVPDISGTNKASRLELWTQPVSPKIETGIFYSNESSQTPCTPIEKSELTAPNWSPGALRVERGSDFIALGRDSSLDLTDWQLVFLPGRSVSDRHAEIHDKAYSLWSSVWSKTFNDLDGNGTLYSDDFSRRDEIVALCYRDEPVALSLFHRLDLRRAAHRSDSYFKPSPESLLDTIIAEAKHDVLIGSYFTLASKFRKGRTEVPVKEILGFSLTDFPELPTTSAMHESQYFRVEHRDPTMLFGYILALEGLSVAYGGQIYDLASSKFGKACRFLKVHVEEDIEHLETALRARSEITCSQGAELRHEGEARGGSVPGVLDRRATKPSRRSAVHCGQVISERALRHIESLSENRQALIRQNLTYTCHMYNVFLDGIVHAANDE